MTMSPEDRRVLRARARALARPPQGPASASVEILEFRLADERYGVETRHVSRVHELVDITPVPCTPPFVLGIVNLRGHITPVIDIKKFFDLPQSGLTDLHRIILVSGKGFDLGLLADVVVGVRSIPVDSLQPALPTLTGIGADYLKGVTAERLVLLDMERILADKRIVTHEEVEP